MAKTEKFSKVIDIKVTPKREDHPPIPRKVVDNAIEKAKQSATEEIRKYYDVEKEAADVEVTVR